MIGVILAENEARRAVVGRGKAVSDCVYKAPPAYCSFAGQPSTVI